MRFEYRYGGVTYALELVPGPDGYLVYQDGRLLGALPPQAQAVRQGRNLWVHADAHSFALQRVVGSSGSAAAAGNELSLRAPMPGQVRSVAIKVGQAVAAGQVLLTLDAMKMEIRIQAARAGVVAHLAVGEGDSVERDQLLVELEAEA